MSKTPPPLGLPPRPEKGEGMPIEQAPLPGAVVAPAAPAPAARPNMGLPTNSSPMRLKTQAKHDEHAIESLQQLIDSFDPAQRERLAQAGINVPTGDIKSIFTGEHTWGYRCTACNNLALYFIGAHWTIGGIEYSEPPPLSHDQLSWTQDLPPHEINRWHPVCQHCRIPLPLNADGSFARERRRIVLLAEWDRSREKRFDRAAARKNDRDAARAAQGATTEAGKKLDVSNDYMLRDRKASELIAETHGEQFVQQLDAAMERTGVTKALATGKP